MPQTHATDAGEQKLLDDVAEYGWHCMHVLEEGELPSFSYTVGLFETYGHPELLIYGLRREPSHAILTLVANAAKAGNPIDFDLPTEELLSDLPCVFVEVPRSHYKEHFGYAIWYYEGNDFPVQQVVWPSKNGLFPWHAQASESFRKTQPVLGTARGDA